MARRTAKELWDALDEATLEAELESELAMTPEERRLDLVKAGYDIDELGAEADAFFASLPAKVVPPAAPAAPMPPEPAAPTPKVAPLVPIRKSWRNLAILAAAACVGLGVILVIQSQPDNVAHRPPPSNRDIAEADRDMAEASCALKDWAACKDRLDEAARLDPDGESEPRVVKARGDIAVGVGGHPVDAGGMEKPGP